MSAAAKSEVVTLQPALPAVLTPMQMVEKAITSGAGMEVIAQLMDMQERWDRMQARKAFDAAIAAAKAEIPVIGKNREVDFTSQKGRTNYRHEDLAGIAKIVDPILGRHGLSYRYRTSSNVNEPVVVTCILSHRDGHSEETTLTGGRDDTGNKNSLQAVGSTITYLQRYTLKAALGLAASADDDAKSVDAGDAVDQTQLAALQAEIARVGMNIKRFCAKYKIDGVADLPAKDFDVAMAALSEYEARAAAVAKQKEATNG